MPRLMRLWDPSHRLIKVEHDFSEAFLCELHKFSKVPLVKIKTVLLDYPFEIEELITFIQKHKLHQPKLKDWEFKLDAACRIKSKLASFIYNEDMQ